MSGSYEIVKTIESGIERISYCPHELKSATPILLQHGMWQSAWVWENWQVRLAELGWESHAYSLPGHGESLEQRSLRWCTLNYYLEFLKAEMNRFSRKPVLMGHSMGGALVQWYLKYVADDLPAAVLVASWNSHEMQSATLSAMMQDPLGVLWSFLSLSAWPAVRNEQVAARLLMSAQSVISPQRLMEKLGEESLWLLMQYNPILWQPLPNPRTPMLWLIPGKDKAISPLRQRASASFYGAEILDVPEAAHNLMMEPNYAELAENIEVWLNKVL